MADDDPLVTGPIPVRSSAITTVSYDENQQEMVIWFSSGNSYNLSGVSRETFQEFMNAPSKGEYWNNNMKGMY